jgi:hypothetical protein
MLLLIEIRGAVVLLLRSEQLIGLSIEFIALVVLGLIRAPNVIWR